MKKRLKDVFVPHKDNNHKPHLLKEVGVIVVVLIATLSFLASVLHGAVLLKSIDLVAAIFPRVLVDLTNEDRYENNISTLTSSSLLEKAAQLKADHMAEFGYFSHNSPDGITPWHWFREAGYQFTRAGENLAVNFVDSDDVERAWMESPGHRANILNDSFTEIGIAAAEGIYKGEKTIFVVQLFGSPASVRPVFVEATPTPAPETVLVVPTPIPDTVPELPLEIIEETDTFIAVAVPESEEEEAGTPATTGEDVLAPTPEGGETELAGVEATGLVAQASLWQRLASQPRTLLQWVYILLASVILLVLTATIFIEIEKQHPKNVAYGLLLLVLLVVLVYANRHFVFTDLLII